MTDNEIIIRRAISLKEMAKGDGWGDVRDLVSEKKSKIEAEVTRTVMRGEVDTRVIDGQRGFIDGMKWVLDRPSATQRSFDRIHKEETGGITRRNRN